MNTKFIRIMIQCNSPSGTRDREQADCATIDWVIELQADRLRREETVLKKVCVFCCGPSLSVEWISIERTSKPLSILIIIVLIWVGVNDKSVQSLSNTILAKNTTIQWLHPVKTNNWRW